ncbi:arsenate reductase family protein [Bacteroidota bacterium]
MLKIYHNTRCRKSRAGLDYVLAKGIDYEIIEYLKKPLSETELADLINKTGKKPIELVRTQEEIYKKNYKGKNLSDDEWIKVLAENPKLIQRPIIVNGNKAVLGDIVENIDTLL